jgi:outer membrane protein OmpA-like peptidoglycan-associated protein
MLEAMTVSYFVLAAVFSIFAIASTPAPEQIAKVLPPEITKALEASNVLPEKIKQLEEKLEKKEPDDMKDFLKGLKEATARGAEDQGAASKFIDKFLEGMGAKVGERAGEDLFDRVSNLLKCDGSHLVTIKGFNRDSARVPEGTEAMLSKIVKLAEKYKEASIEIQGYTDHRGDDSYNALLSKRRAEAIASLLKQKLGRTKISVFAEGKAFPRTVEGEQRDSAENRRVDVWLRCVEYAP